MNTRVAVTHCPAQLKRLVLALAGHMDHRVSLQQPRAASDSVRSEPPCLKLPFLVGVTAVGMALGIAPASADVTCIGSGLSPEGTGTTVQGQATFTVAPETLTVVLKNTSATTPKQADLLTGVVFNIAGNPSLTYNATANPTLPPSANIWKKPGPVINNAEPLFDGFGSSWTNAVTSMTYAYGVATTGWTNMFNAGSITVGNGGPDYGIATQGWGNQVSGGNAYPLVEDSLQFVFTTSGIFTQADIKDVKFLFGTAGTPDTGQPPQNCVVTDFGDAPDTGPTTGPGNYKTTLAHGGPSHVVGRPVYLGTIPPDGDSGMLQNNTATADDLTDAPDEDGVQAGQFPTITTMSTSSSMLVTGANLTGGSSGFPAVAATLACWVDFNRNGVFGDIPSERGMSGSLPYVSIPAGTSPTTYKLTFSGYPAAGTTGTTYLRCRISSDPTFATNPQPIGPASDGEVEDYAVPILTACKPTAISQVPASGTLLNGLGFSVTAATSGLADVASITCQKMINFAASGLTFTPTQTGGPTGTPPTWTWSPAEPSVAVVARKAAAGSATLACTAQDSFGAMCSTDPVIEDVLRVKGQAVTLKANNGEPLPRSMHFVKIMNGSPGLSDLEINVNGTKFKQAGLQEGQSADLNIASAMLRDDNYISLTGKGRPGGTASVFISDTPFK